MADARLANMVANQTRLTEYKIGGKELREIRTRDVQNIHQILANLKPQMILQGVKEWKVVNVYDTNNPREKFRSGKFKPVGGQYDFEEMEDYFAAQVDKPIIEYRIMYSK